MSRQVNVSPFQFAKYGLWAGIASIGNLLNPFNIGNFIVSIIVLSPSFLFFWLSTKFAEPGKPVALDQSTHGPRAPSRVKSIFQVIGLFAVEAIFILFVGLTWYRDLIRPYTWSDSIVHEAKAGGWDLAIGEERPQPASLDLVYAIPARTRICRDRSRETFR